MSRAVESPVERLMQQAERAIEQNRGRRTLEPILERLLQVAPDGSDASLFAHRHLAELRVEEHPWRALLHLRRVAVATPDDHPVHAMMGLAHAMLGNFRSAVAAYRAALAVTPGNPFYLHNLGHLLDLGMDRPAEALSHLVRADEGVDGQDPDIAASLAQTLVRLERFVDARAVVDRAQRHATRHDGLASLAREIDEHVGRRDEKTPATRETNKRAGRDDAKPTDARPKKKAPDTAPPDPSKQSGSVSAADLLEQGLHEHGASQRVLGRALKMLRDYDRAVTKRGAPSRATKASVTAAAVHYALLRIDGHGADALATIAADYGVTTRAVQTRFEDIAALLNLYGNDRRYR